MQFMLLIYDDEKVWEGFSEEERKGFIGEYFALTDDLRRAGAYVAGDPLEPVAAATTVRIRDGERLLTDGPFAETKEQLGGYYIVDAETIEEAAVWAARIPAARYGSVEVRPVMQVPAREEVEA